MLSPCDNAFLDLSNSLPNDVDALASSPSSNNAISHTVAPSSQDQRKQPLVDRSLSTINPGISQPSGALSNPVVKTTISHGSLSPQHGVAPVLPTRNSATFLVDRVSTTVNTGGQLATPAIQYPPLPPGPVSSHRKRPACFVAIPATARTRGDSVNYMSAENVSGAGQVREHVQRCSIGDAKTVLTFNGIFIPIVASFIMESYKLLSPNIGQKPSPPPAASIIIVNVLWVISLVLSITLTIFATSKLIEQWTSGCIRLPQVPRTPLHGRSYLFLCTLSVFLFLTGLVIFFFTIDKIVGIVVLIVSTSVGLFGMVYLVLRPYLYRRLLLLSHPDVR